MRALDESGDAHRRSELLKAGVPERALARAVAAGRVLRVAPGTYALPSAPRDVTLARKFRAQVGCISACDHWGLPLWGRDAGTHLLVPRNRSASRRDKHDLANVTVHRTAAFSGENLWAPLAEAIAQASRCTSPLQQLVLIDAALHQGFLLPADLRCLRIRDARRREWLQRMASNSAESPLEAVTRAVLVMSGFVVQEQVRVRGVVRVDLVVEHAVAVEADGWQYHQGRDAFERDRARDRAMLVTKLPVMRFTSRELRGDLAEVAAQVAAVVNRAPHRNLESRLAWALRK